MFKFEKVFNIDINGVSHTIKCNLNSLKGSFIITIDEKEITLKNQHKFLLLLDYEFEIDGTVCNLTYTFFERAFNLAVNKKYLHTNKAYEPLAIPKYVNVLTYISIFLPCILVGALAGIKGTNISVILSAFILVIIGLISGNIYAKLFFLKKKNLIAPTFLISSLVQCIVLLFVTI